MKSLLPALAFALLSGSAAAAEGASVRFEHKDWELACDNTRTCRAAGYQRDGAEPAVSVLFTRAAGPNQPVAGKVTLGNYDVQGANPAVPAQVTLTIDARPVGRIGLGRDDATGDLGTDQVRALLQALQRTSEIAFVAGGDRWKLSGEGAAAVLLRMDEAQGRVGTAGALVRKGNAGEEGVRPALAKPVVRAVAVPADGAPPPQALALAVLRSLKRAPDECPDLKEPSEAPSIWRLAPGKVLVSARCWLAAYNAGFGYWIASDKAPYRPQVVSYDVTDFEPQAGRLLTVQKGRGLGDCLSTKEWVWDGARFVPTEESTTGKCRMVAAGGAWSLPTLVSEVVPPAGTRTTEEKRK